LTRGIGDLVKRSKQERCDDGLLGSMGSLDVLFAKGAKAVLLLDHTSCGAIKGAIEDVVVGECLGNSRAVSVLAQNY